MPHCCGFCSLVFRLTHECVFADIPFSQQGRRWPPRADGLGDMSRRAKVLSNDQRSAVSRVRTLARQRARVSDSYISAILVARESGATYASIAEAAGTSSQAVQEIVRRHGAGSPEGSECDDAGSAIVEETDPE